MFEQHAREYFIFRSAHFQIKQNIRKVKKIVQKLALFCFVSAGRQIVNNLKDHGSRIFLGIVHLE